MNFALHIGSNDSRTRLLGTVRDSISQGVHSVNGATAAEGKMSPTQSDNFSADETADVGIDLGAPVVDAIGSNPMVTIDVK
jgi:hypothetical protein